MFNKIFTDTKEQYQKDLQIEKETGVKSDLLKRIELMNKGK